MFRAEELRSILTWAQKTLEFFINSGETEFEELRRREKLKLYQYLVDTGIEIEDCGEVRRAKFDYDACYICIDFSSSNGYDFEKTISTLEYCFFKEGCRFENEEDAITSLKEFISLVKEVLNTDVTIVNLTPHAVTFYAQDGKTIINTIPSSGIARAVQTRKPINNINGIPVSKTGYGAVEGLPDKQDNTIFIVSVLTAQAAKGRDDLYIVDDLIRDDAGCILGCKALAQI